MKLRKRKNGTLWSRVALLGVLGLAILFLLLFTDAGRNAWRAGQALVGAARLLSGR